MNSLEKHFAPSSDEAVTINELLERVPEVEPANDIAPLESVDLTDLIANAVKTAKLFKPQGKPLGSSRPVTVRGTGPSIVELIREGRR